MRYTQGQHIRSIPVLIVLCLFTFSATLGITGKNIAFAQASTNVLRVAPSGSDVGNCGSVATPCKSIQFAVNQAESGATLLVAGGTYTYNAANDVCDFLTTRAVVCWVNKNLTILGGYAPSNWTEASPTSNPTIIDGQNARRGMAAVGFNGRSDLRLEGFTIQNAVAQGLSGGDPFLTTAFGAGLLVQSSVLTLRDSAFRNNRATGANLTSGEGGVGAGGALALLQAPGGSTSVLENVVFERNQALGGNGPTRGGLGTGGAIFTNLSTIVGYNLQFLNNRAVAANSTGNGVGANGLQADGLGGGLYQGAGSATLYNTLATGNEAIGGNAATAGGGGYGGAFYAEDARLSLVNTVVRQSLARGGDAATGGVAFGGAIEAFNADLTVDRSQFVENLAKAGGSTNGGKSGAPGGGGISISTFTGTRSIAVSNSVFAANRIEIGAGSTQGGGGAAIGIQGTSGKITHTTFARNTLGPTLVVGQAVLVQGTAGGGGTPSVVAMEYNLIADHTGASDASTLHVAAGSTVNLKRGMFVNNSRNTNSDNVPLAAGTFNGLNTMLTASSAQFVAPGAPNHNYRISAASPARDQAIGSMTNYDLDNQIRPTGAAADIGADEYQQPLPRVIYLPRTIK